MNYPDFHLRISSKKTYFIFDVKRDNTDQGYKRHVIGLSSYKAYLYVIVIWDATLAIFFKYE